MATSHISPRTRSSSILSLSAWAIILPLATFGLFSILSGSFPAASSSIFDKVGLATPSAFASKTAARTAMSAAFLDAVKSRRTWYALDRNLPVGQDRIKTIVEEAVQTVPSAFNSQSNRAVVLFGTDHEKLWEIVTDVLKARVSEDQWVSTAQKTAGFTAAAATVLFFVDDAVVQSYAENIPTYADQFPVWAAQSDAMLQYVIWTALEAEGLGANLQHYNPLIDAKVSEAWSLPASWRLTAQLVLGGRPATDLEPMEKKPLDGKLKIFGASL